jgi:Na+/melibiose symporter-like transporter
MGGIACLVIFYQLPIDLRLLGLFPANGSDILLPILLASLMIAVLGLAIGLIAVLSMLGDISDENELLTGLRQEGLIFSARAFFAKASNSVGHFVAGVSLDLFIVLPFEAVPGAVDDDVVWRLGLIAGPVMAIAGLVAIPIYSRYRLSRTNHSMILDALDTRRLDDDDEDRSPIN